MQKVAAHKADKSREPSSDQGGDGSQTIALRSELARKISAHIQVEGDQITPVPGLVLFRRTALTSCYSATYEPSIIVYGQGQKHVNVGGTAQYMSGGLSKKSSPLAVGTAQAPRRYISRAALT